MANIRMTPRQLKALSEIYPAYGRPVSRSNDLAHRLGCSEKQARRTLDALLRKGLVSVDGDDEDAFWLVEHHPRFDVARLEYDSYGNVYAVRR